jgi:pimeloyl-ACP methyl ester carboxylesterase
VEDEPVWRAEGDPKKILEVVMINRFAVFTTMLCSAVLLSTPNLQARQSEVKNIVLVHGAWADGSGWTGVYDILVSDGFNVTVVQEPETSFQNDVTAVKRILALQDGPSILVAHSYGGSVVTEAGTDPSVVGLVYVAAHMPDAGESESGDGRLFPSDLSKSNAMETTADGFTFLDPARFPFFFAADLPVELAAFMAHSQVFNAAVNFQFVITRPAWREKPSWMVVAGADRIINPDLERFYAARAGSRTVEVAGASHSVFISHPEEVADVIEDAARAPSVMRRLPQGSRAQPTQSGHLAAHF